MFGRSFARFSNVRLRDRGLAWGFALVALLALFATLGAWFAADPLASDFERGVAANGLPMAPSAEHWFGTDRLFRDELARAAIGLRFSLIIGIFSTLLALVVGGCVGTAAGYSAHRPLFSFTRFGFSLSLDTILMRIVDVGLALPFLLLAMAIASAFEKPSGLTILLTLGATGWLGTARIMRSRVLEVRERDFVTASTALGASTARLLWAHVAPNSLGPLLVIGSLSVGQMILAESVMSYLGAGVAPPTPTLGHMLFEGQDSLQSAPWLFWIPALLILACALGFHLIGEGLRERFREPERRP